MAICVLRADLGSASRTLSYPYDHTGHFGAVHPQSHYRIASLWHHRGTGPLACFYHYYGVSDTVNGRFEMIVLHSCCSAARRKGRSQPAVRRLGQAFSMCSASDMDDNLREMGVGDLAVPRRMRQFGEAFYGRQAAYGAALSHDPQELEKVLARNVFGGWMQREKAAPLARLYACGGCRNWTPSRMIS